MKNHFENKIREKLKGFPFEKSGLDANKEKIWVNIQNKDTPKHFRKIKFRQIMTHAAALIIGIIFSGITCLFIFKYKTYHYNNQHVNFSNIYSYKKENLVKIDTVLIEKPVEKNIVRNKNSINKHIIPKNQAIIIPPNPKSPNINILSEVDPDITMTFNVEEQNSLPTKIKKIIHWSDVQKNYQHVESEEKTKIIMALVNGKTQESETFRNTHGFLPINAFVKSIQNN